jgi:toxin secretion/phage lysis holin
MNDDAIKAGLASILGVLTALVGGFDLALQTLFLFMALDIVSGVVAAGATKSLNSSVAYKGWFKKASVILAVVLAAGLDKVLSPDIPIFRAATVLYFIANEGLSITENLALAGVK